MRVKLLEPIEGFEDVAEYRKVKRNEWYVAMTGKPLCATHDHDVCFVPVLTPIKRWRPATIDDAVRAIRGEKVLARGRDEPSAQWRAMELTGYRLNTAFPWLSKDSCHAHCEVLDA